MTIYSFWIFDKHCNCIYDREWTLLGNPKSGTTNSKQNDDIAKLLYGIIFSLRSISGKLTTAGSDNANEIRSISTGKFRVHTYCTATGLWFILLTDFKPINYDKILKHIYANIFVKDISCNYLSPYDFAENEAEMRGQGVRKITNRHFMGNLEKYLETWISA